MVISGVRPTGSFLFGAGVRAGRVADCSRLATLFQVLAERRIVTAVAVCRAQIDNIDCLQNH